MLTLKKRPLVMSYNSLMNPFLPKLISEKNLDGLSMNILKDLKKKHIQRQIKIYVDLKNFTKLGSII